MSPGRYNVIYGFTTSVGVVLVALTITLVVRYRNGFAWSSDPSGQFNYHPLLMVLSLVFLYSQSILIYRSGRYMTSKKNLNYMHGFIHLVAFVAAVIGLQAVFDSHNRTGLANLYSLHSWVGLLTVIIFAAQFLCGFVAFLYPGLPGPMRKSIMPHHVFFGIIAFVMAIVSTISGITEIALWTNGYSTLPSVAYYMNFIGLFAVLYGALTIYLLIKPEFKRIPLPED